MCNKSQNRFLFPLRGKKIIKMYIRKFLLFVIFEKVSFLSIIRKRNTRFGKNRDVNGVNFFYLFLYKWKFFWELDRENVSSASQREIIHVLRSKLINFSFFCLKYVIFRQIWFGFSTTTKFSSSRWFSDHCSPEIE